MSDFSDQIDELFESLDKPVKQEIKEAKQPRKVHIDSHSLDALFDGSIGVHEIHELVEEFKPEVIEEIEEPKQYIEEVAGKTQQQSLAESISRYHAKTNQSLEEVAPVSDGERIKLLEDAFAQMRRAQPNTLVSGIGASLDSGGGAVWLWDLDDVNIGSPSNGQYPVINDNDVLKFDSATKKWVPGTPSGGSSNDLPLAGGTMTGDIVFNDGQEFPGTLELNGGTMTGDIVFNSGQTIAGYLPLAGGAIAGDTTYAGSTAGNTNLQTKASVNALIAGATSGGFEFKGTTDITGAAPGSPSAGDFYINTVAGTAANSWTGIAGLTIAADQMIIYSGAESRWFAGAVEDNSTYLAKTGGTMTGDIVFAGSQTFPASITFGYLPTTGGIMAGDVTFTDGVLTTKEIIVSQGSEIVIKRGTSNSAVGGLDIKGYGNNDFQAQTDMFAVGYGNGTSTMDYINYKGKTSSSFNIQNKQSVDAAIAAAVVEGSNLLDGGTISSTGGAANASGTLTLQQNDSLASTTGTIYIKAFGGTDSITLDPDGKITINPPNSIPHIYFKGLEGGKFSVDNSQKFHWSDQANDFMTLDAQELTLLSPALFTGSTFIVERGVPSGSNATNFVLKGMLPSSVGTITSSLVSIKRSSFSGDTLQYFGNTDTNNNAVQTKGSCDANYASKTTSNSFSGQQSFHNPTGNSHAAITVRDADGTGYPFGVFGNGNIETDGKMIIGRLGAGIKIANCDSQEDGVGALSFHFQGNTQPVEGHILFSGSGAPDGSTASEWIFARDTVTSNVVAADKYFSLVAPAGVQPGVKTVFHQPVEVPSPTSDAHAATKLYVDALKANIYNAVNASTDYATLKSGLLAALS